MRCSGFFDRQRLTVRCRPGGRFGASCETAGGSSLRIALIVSADVAFRKAGLPVSISCCEDVTARVGSLSAYLLGRHVADRAQHVFRASLLLEAGGGAVGT